MAKLPTRSKIFELVGESFENSDGSSRQDELLRCAPGETVTLLCQTDNPHDENAVLAVSCRGVAIGHLGRGTAAELRPHLLSRRHRAKIHELRGGIPGFPSYGCIISVAWDDRPEHPHARRDPEQAAEREKRLLRKARAPVPAPKALPPRSSGRVLGMILIAVLALLAVVRLIR